MVNTTEGDTFDNFLLRYKLTLTVLWSIHLILPDLKMWSIIIISKAKSILL